MTKLTFIIALGLVSFTLINKNTFIKYDETKKEACEISYNKIRKLNWGDFKLVGKTGRIAALSNTGFSYETVRINEKLSVYINCVFNKKGSFVVNGNMNESILNHEQRHFDITYLYTCKFIERLNNEQALDESKIDLIYNDIIIEWGDYQKKYDGCIRNPIQDYDKQKEWDIKIDKELSKYN
jgi:hypothetical protein